MVKSHVSSGTVYFENYMRDKENTQFFRPANTLLRRIRLQVNNDRYFSETLIAFRDDATSGFDLRYDGRKLIAYNNLNVYTKINGSFFAIQSLPEDTLHSGRDITVPISIQVGEAGQYVFTVNMFEQWDDFNVVLRDNYLNIDTPLELMSSYRFYSGTGTFDDRFELVFSERPLKNDSNERLLENLYPNPVEDVLNLQFTEPVSGELTIVDLNGKMVMAKNIENTASMKIPVSHLSKGVYILQVKTDEISKEYQFIKR
jgi:hypothetical protein